MGIFIRIALTVSNMTGIDIYMYFKFSSMQLTISCSILVASILDHSDEINYIIVEYLTICSLDFYVRFVKDKGFFCPDVEVAVCTGKGKCIIA